MRLSYFRCLRVLIVLLASCWVCQGADARFADISLEEERRLAQAAVAAIAKDPDVRGIKTNGDLLRLQREIVTANPGVLWFADGKKQTFLRPVREINYRSRVIRAFNCQDGYIFVSTDYINFANRFLLQTNFERKNRPENIYNNAHLAWTLGHEMAHWKNEQLLKRSAKQDVAFENNADLNSLDYLDGTLCHGYGGGLIAKYRNRELDEKKLGQIEKDTHHASNAYRYRNMANYIKDASKGRIRLKEDGRTTYDGKPFAETISHGGFAPRYQLRGKAPDGLREERTMYVAGQIAFAIKYGVWDTDHLLLRTQSAVFGNGSGNLVLLVKNPQSGGYKVIDKFAVTRQRWEEIKPLVNNFPANIEQQGLKLSDEEKYLLTIISYAAKK